MGRLILPANYRRAKWRKTYTKTDDVTLSDESAKAYGEIIRNKARMMCLEICGLEGKPVEFRLEQLGPGKQEGTRRVKVTLVLEDGRWDESAFNQINDAAYAYVRKLMKLNAAC